MADRTLPPTTATVAAASDRVSTLTRASEANVRLHAALTAGDCGTNRVMVPHVQSAGEAARAVGAARYGPSGGDSFAPLTTYGALGTFEATVGASVLVVLQIEGLAAVEKAGEIAAVPGVDAVLVGPYDLSQALGCPGDVASPQVADAAERVAAACRDRVTLGIRWRARVLIGLDGARLPAAMRRVRRPDAARRRQDDARHRTRCEMTLHGRSDACLSRPTRSSTCDHRVPRHDVRTVSGEAFDARHRG
jgi:hypothetical protein